MEHFDSLLFLDSGDPSETKKIIKLLGFINGQTTNPSLISRNPYLSSVFTQGTRFSLDNFINEYQKIVQKISKLIPKGSISIEVYCDNKTDEIQMYEQAKEMNSWIPNAHIKLPITKKGLITAIKCLNENININMTLCFSQEQAAAVYSATKGCKRGDVYISPFIGRLDDIGLNGLSLVKNILKMYEDSDGHVMLIAASIRDPYHLQASLNLRSDIITIPFHVFNNWKSKQNIETHETNKSLKIISFKEIGLNKKWNEYNIHHDLTIKGIEGFAYDWNKFIKN